jgi:hypothetical protein
MDDPHTGPSLPPIKPPSGRWGRQSFVPSMSELTFLGPAQSLSPRYPSTPPALKSLDSAVMVGHLRSDSLATTALARLHRALVRLPRRIDLPGPAQPHSRRSSTSFHAPGFLARTASGAVDVPRVVPGLAHRCLASLFDNQTGDSPAGACHGGSPRAAQVSGAARIPTIAYGMGSIMAGTG